MSKPKIIISIFPLCVFLIIFIFGCDVRETETEQTDNGNRREKILSPLHEAAEEVTGMRAIKTGERLKEELEKIQKQQHDYYEQMDLLED